MAHDLQELYQRFEAYVLRLQADVEKATRDLPPEKARAFHWPVPSFAEFDRFWQRIQSDPQFLQQWTRRLSPGGYDEERAAIRARLVECSRRECADDCARPATGMDKAA